MMRKLAVIIYHVLKKRQNFYHINEEVHKRKLHEWLRILNQMRSLTGDPLNRWENEIRIKYDPGYRSRKTAELKKPAWLYHRGGVGRKATSSQIPHGCGAFYKQEGGGEEKIPQRIQACMEIRLPKKKTCLRVTTSKNASLPALFFLKINTKTFPILCD